MDKLTWRESQLIQQAQIWKQEAMTANSTITEIYRLCSDCRGEPGNWNGAEPVRRKLAELRALKSENSRVTAGRREDG